MKNTKEPKTITSKKATGKIIRGVCIFGIAIAIFTAGKNDKDQTNTINLESEEYGYYTTNYLQNIREIDISEYDKKFEELCAKAIIIYNDKQYESDAIYIAKLEDGTIHLINSNNNKVDFITGVSLDSKRVKTMRWTDSSSFHEIYELGLITDNNIKLSENMIDMILNWDGEKHYQTVTQVAEKKTSEDYQKKYGGN